jgi:hypothetical protein
MTLITLMELSALFRQLGQMDVFSGEFRNSQSHAWRNNQGGSPWRIPVVTVDEVLDVGD